VTDGGSRGDAPKDPRAGLKPHEEWATFVVKKGCFSAEECAGIVALGGAMTPGTMGGEPDNPRLRDSEVAWIGQDEATRWLFERLREPLVAANARFLHLALSGFTEPLQLAAYGPAQHYNWHTDVGPGTFRTRKLSFVVQLSDPADYEGGALEIATDSRPKAMARDQGALIMFPAYVMHRVTPVTRGLRRSLVGWIGGPPFT
jgi:PKHD-type hydroxylase